MESPKSPEKSQAEPSQSAVFDSVDPTALEDTKNHQKKVRKSSKTSN